MTCSDPSKLANDARCLNQCIPKGFQDAITISLLCQIINSSGPTSISFRVTDVGDFRTTDSGDNRIWIL
jgi:hypothetical protein